MIDERRGDIGRWARSVARSFFLNTIPGSRSRNGVFLQARYATPIIMLLCCYELERQSRLRWYSLRSVRPAL
jgi:hypothetical protein